MNLMWRNISVLGLTIMFDQIITAKVMDTELDSAPFPQEWVLDGQPKAYNKQIASSSDGGLRIIVWACTVGRFRWHYAENEMLHIVSGEVFILDHTGAERRLGPGDTAFFPAGSSSIWRVTQEVRKLAVCHDPLLSIKRFLALMRARFTLPISSRARAEKRI